VHYDTILQVFVNSYKASNLQLLMKVVPVKAPSMVRRRGGAASNRALPGHLPAHSRRDMPCATPLPNQSDSDSNSKANSPTRFESDVRLPAQFTARTR